jgi:hypothetical protein
MDTKFKFVALLVVCGTICILAALGLATYLYYLNASSLDISNNAGDRSCLVFGAFVGVPSIAVFAAGAIMVSIGIKTGLKN